MLTNHRVFVYISFIIYVHLFCIPEDKINISFILWKTVSDIKKKVQTVKKIIIKKNDKLAELKLKLAKT